MKPLRLIRHDLMTFCFTFLLVACQSEGGDPADANKLVLYSGRSESLVAPIIDQFSEATGIDVEVRYGGTAELAATILEEGENSPADVFYAQDPGGLGAIEAADLLAELPAATVAKVPDRFASESRRWVGISGRARVVVYNTETLSPEDMPSDMWGFTTPEWEGRIGWAPTNGSFQAMITGMRAVWGEAKTRDWLDAIQANDPVAYEKNTPIVAAVASGEVEVGFVNHYYLHRFLAEEGEGFTARNHFLTGNGPGSLVMVSGAGILKTSANPDNAQKFIDFLLTLPAQQYFASQTFEYPVVEGIVISSNLTELGMLDASALNVSLSGLADLHGTAELLSDVGILP